MKLANHLELARDEYITYYREKLTELKREHATCVTELLVQPNGAQNPPPFSLIRLDAMCGAPSSPNPFRIALQRRLTTQFIEVEHDGLKVQFGFVSWECATVSFEARRFALSCLRDWWSKWLDDQEIRPIDEFGFAGVAHSIAWNSSGGGLWEITVDFGSAPVACALEFFDILLRQGITSCCFETNEKRPPEKPAL